MKNRLLCLIFACVVIFTFAAPVLADTGPKPSVSVDITGAGDDICYATLLSDSDSTGPASAYEGSDPRSETELPDYDVWLKFVEYEDSDGYFYLQQHWPCEGSSSFTWSYYPPDPFKVLLYFPAYDSFVVSNSCERYTFESYYTVDLTGIDYQKEGSVSTVHASRQATLGTDALSIAFRLAVTLLIEIGIALVFKYREKKQLILIIATNLITQIGLNLLVNLAYTDAGFFWSMLAYVILEFCVFAVEAIIYIAFMKNLSTKPIKRWPTIFYALAANLASFLFGLAFSILQAGVL